MDWRIDGLMVWSLALARLVAPERPEDDGKRFSSDGRCITCCLSERRYRESGPGRGKGSGFVPYRRLADFYFGAPTRDILNKSHPLRVPPERS